jgi:signal peptidase
MNQIRIITKKIENVLCVVLLIILIFAVYAKVKITFNKDIHTNFFGYRVFEVASGSMEPTLSINDLLIVKVSDEELKKDDIIAYMRDDSIITHRIIMVDENSLIVKGDANNTIDSPINKDQVIGKVVKVLPQFGVWHKIFSEPKILVLMFITLLLFDFALSYGIKNEETKKDENVSSKDKTKKTTTKQKEVVEEKVEDKVEDKEEEIVIKEIKNEEKKKKEQKEKLLEFTRKIDLSQ